MKKVKNLSTPEDIKTYVARIRREQNFSGRAENRLRYYKRKYGAPEFLQDLNM